MIIVGHAGHLFGLKADTGQVSWSIDFASLDQCGGCAGEAVEVQPADDATVYAACAGHVFRIAVDDGSIHWHSSLRQRGSSDTSLALFKK